jgi:hypothetical protein
VPQKSGYPERLDDTHLDHVAVPAFHRVEPSSGPSPESLDITSFPS